MLKFSDNHCNIDCSCHCEVVSTVAISSEKAGLLRFTRNDILIAGFGNKVISKATSLSLSVIAEGAPSQVIDFRYSSDSYNN